MSQLDLFSDVSARYSDPDTSHVTVRSISADSGQARLLLDIAATFEEPFDDWDLTLAAEDRGRRIQRNVVARTRNLMEQAGMFRRVGEYEREHPGCPSGRKYVHFTVTQRVGE